MNEKKGLETAAVNEPTSNPVGEMSQAVYKQMSRLEA